MQMTQARRRTGNQWKAIRRMIVNLLGQFRALLVPFVVLVSGGCASQRGAAPGTAQTWTVTVEVQPQGDNKGVTPVEITADGEGNDGFWLGFHGRTMSNAEAADALEESKRLCGSLTLYIGISQCEDKLTLAGVLKLINGLEDEFIHRHPGGGEIHLILLSGRLDSRLAMEPSAARADTRSTTRNASPVTKP